MTENLFFAGALGIAGERRIAAGALRSLLVQATGLHSPAEVVVTALVSPAWTSEVDWLKWLPHTTSPHSPLETGHLANSQASGRALLSALEQLVEERTSGSAPRGAAAEDASALASGAAVGESSTGADAAATVTPGILLVITDDAPVDRARLVALAEHAADAGVYPVWVSSAVETLPAVTRTYLRVEPDGLRGSVGLVRLGREIPDVQIETLSSADALIFARSLAPVVDAGALVRDQTDLPRSVPFLTLVGSELGTQPSSAVERWRQNDSILDRSGASPKEHKPGRLRALVGSSGADAMHLDLRTQGPHALVGGTTGSGKSEFLQAWVLGMATEYSPDRVTFLFVDYKGGSAFAECVRLPHSVGIVTDLSPHLVRRALTSLRAELHFRETLFARRGAKDIMDLEKKGDPETPPALVIVIDEFAALASEVPEFVDGVVDIAQRGRSFGIHLIMATQRPAGVIRDNLRANTNLRVALRMADESDSIDVVGDRIAGTFSPEIPGRAVAKTGPGRVTAFQSAYAGGWTSDVPEPPSISISELRFGSEVPWQAPADDNVKEESDDERGPTDQARIVATLRAAASTAAVPEPRRPWLPQLASAYDLTLLGQRTDTRIALGVRDIPETQQQEVLAFHPDTEGSIAVYGASGTGKTVTLRTLAAAAGITPRGGPVEVYGMDFGTGALRMLESLPHVGSIVGSDDPDRIVRLLGRLRDVLDDRGARYSAVDAASLTDYRRISGRADEPRILLLVDNFPGFRSDFESGVGRALWYGVFLRVLSEGRALGVHVALTADRPGSVPTAVSSNIPKRVVLRQTEDSSYVLLGVPGDVVGPTSPPGRAVVDGLEAQIAIVGGLEGSSDQAEAMKVLGETIARTGRRPAEPIGTLPAEIGVATLPSSVHGHPVLGVSDETLAPLTFDPVGVMLLAGPPASGRSNALSHLVHAVDRAVPGVTRYYFGHPRSRLAQQAGWEAVATTLEDAADLAREVAGAVAEAVPSREAPTPGILVVIEQIADFLNTPADAPLVQLIKAVKRSDHFLVADSETSQWSSTYPLLAEIKSARTGLLLQPDAPEGDMLLRTSLPRVFRTDFPIGRGFHVARGRATRVQIPLEDES